MITGRPKPALTLTTDDQTQLRSLAGPRTLPHALVARARLVLWSADRQSNTQIARRLRLTKATVGKWRQRFVQHRLAGLYDIGTHALTVIFLFTRVLGLIAHAGRGADLGVLKSTVRHARAQFLGSPFSSPSVRLLSVEPRERLDSFVWKR